jgi:UvrB/uvrC motif
VSKDITHILAAWDYSPSEYTVRIVKGDDGRDKIQVRMDLGLLQMEFHGRPDGQRPHESESYLHYFQQRQREHDAANPDGRPFVLETADCELLLREGVQYYHRYLSFWHLRLYELCARDTKRNLELFAFVREFAQSKREKLQFDQYRPYVTMMHTRAVATPLAELRQFDAAIQVVDSGIARIEEFLVDYQQQERSAQCYELQFLLRWREELTLKRDRKPPPPIALGGPGDDLADDEIDAEPGPETINTEAPAEHPVDDATIRRRGASRARKAKLSAQEILNGLREQLQRAITEERYEEAARLRDQIAEASKAESQE